MRKFLVLLLPLVLIATSADARSKKNRSDNEPGPTMGSSAKGIATSDMEKLSQEATKQMNHCEKLQGGLSVQQADFKNLTSDKIDTDNFLKILNQNLESLGPNKKTAEALAALPGGATRLWAEIGASSTTKGKKNIQVFTLSIYAKDGDRQICKVTSELGKTGHK